MSEMAFAVIGQIQMLERQRSIQPNQPQIVTLGDSVTQGGYPRPLQSRLGEGWLIQDLAASGRGLDYAVDTLNSVFLSTLNQQSVDEPIDM